MSIYKVGWSEADLLVNNCVEVAASSASEAGRKYSAMGHYIPRRGSIAVECPDGSVVEIEIESTQAEEGGTDD